MRSQGCFYSYQSPLALAGSHCFACSITGRLPEAMRGVHWRTSKAGWNFFRRRSASMGSKPGAMGPCASHSMRKERTSCLNAVTSPMSFFLKGPCTHTTCPDSGWHPCVALQARCFPGCFNDQSRGWNLGYVQPSSKLAHHHTCSESSDVHYFVQ